MAHNLNIINDKASFFSVGKAWHGLGQIVDTAQTSEEAIKLAQLDYKVGITENYAMINGLYVKTDSRSTYRTDNNTIFSGKLGERYEVVQNTEAFDFFDEIVAEKKAIFETAGCLHNGEVIFITAKLPSYMKVVGDKIDQYLLLKLAHDGSGAIQILFTPIRVVCNNTLNQALKGVKSKVSVRHCKNYKEKLNNAAAVLGIIKNAPSVFEQTFNSLAKVRITDKKVMELIDQIFVGKIDEKGEYSTRITNIKNAVIDYTFGHETQQTESCKGTLFGVYNGVTGYFQNTKKYTDQYAKFDNIISGTDYDTAQRALDLCLIESNK
jgi:phage/plasmid-like protein (TIGR03299 family)